MGNACRPTSTFCQRSAHCRSDRSERNDPATRCCGRTRRRCEKSRLHTLLGTGEKMGKRSWTDSSWCICCNADRLVKALARCGQNAEQGRERRCALSRMELACAEVSLRGSQDHRFGSRNYRHRSRNCHVKG